MKLTIVGGGSIGERHLANALSLGCQVTVYEPRPERADYLRANYPATVLSGLSPDDHWDAVMVCTPWDQHLLFAQEAVRRRTPLFVEKPLGSLEQIEDWRTLVAEAGDLVTQVGYMLRFHRKAIALRALVDDRARAGYFRLSCDMAQWNGGSYGPPLLECSHELDLALWFGAPPVVSNRVDQSSSDVIRLGSDWMVFWTSSSERYWRFWSLGEDASEDQVYAHVAFDSPDKLGTLMYYDELAHFLDCTQTGRQTDCPLADGLRVLEVCKQVEGMAGRAE